MISSAVIFVAVVPALLGVLLIVYCLVRRGVCCKPDSSGGQYERLPTSEEREEKQSIPNGDGRKPTHEMKPVSKEVVEQVTKFKNASDQFYVDLVRPDFEQGQLKRSGIVLRDSLGDLKIQKFEQVDAETPKVEHVHLTQYNVRMHEQMQRDRTQASPKWLEAPSPIPPPAQTVSAYGDVAMRPLAFVKSMDASSVASTVSLCSRNFLIDDCKLHFSMLYSKSDMFLMVKLSFVDCVPAEFKLYRLSLALLPVKSYRAKTKHVLATEDRIVRFDESFRLANITKEGLFSSAFRIRLYARVKIAKEKCLGETVVHLADVANRVGGFATSRKFEPMVKHR